MITQCPFCNELTEHKVTKKQLEEFSKPNRKLIQEIFPEMPAEEREQLISGICPTCWNKMFVEGGEEE